MTGVDYVFHAAALKQVPSCEFFPLQAVATNVQGSDNVIRAAHECGVKSVVCLSTDKAVYPINAMGISKAMMEKVAQAFARNHPESADGGVDHPLRQRDVLPRLGDPAVRRAGPLRAAADGHRPGHDPVPDVPGRVGGAGAVRLRQRPARGPVRAQGPRLHRGRPGPRGGPGARGGRAGDPGDRHPARGEALRVAALPRGDGRGRGLRGLLPRPPGRAIPQLRHVRRAGHRGNRRDRRLHLPQHHGGSRSRRSRRSSRGCRRCSEALRRGASGDVRDRRASRDRRSPGRTGSSRGMCAAPPGPAGAGT